MPEFPATPPPSFSLVTKQRFRTIITNLDGNNEQRRRRQLFPKYDVSVQYEVLEKAELQALWNFYQARSGAYEDFHFYDPQSNVWAGLYVATADGEDTIFDLPGKGTSEQAIYLNGEEQGSGFTILVGGGGSSSDRVEFSSAPAAGTIVTCDFTGYLRIRCRFEEDEMSKEWFTVACLRTGLKLKGL